MSDDLSIEVFDKNLVPLDHLERFTGLRWLERFTSYGEFELWCPITEKNSELLKDENYIWINKSKTAGVIEYIEKSKNENNEKEFHVKGRHLIAKLRGRVIYPTFNGSGLISAIMKQQVNDYAINPKNVANKLEVLQIAQSQDFGDMVTYQQTGSDLLEEQLYLCEANNVGIRVDLDYNNHKMIYNVLKPVNRSVNQSATMPVVFDSSSDEILSSNYVANKSEVCNVAIVAGEGEGSARKVIEVQEGFYPITNLVQNGSFENGIWGHGTAATFELSTEKATRGTQSLKSIGTTNTYVWAYSNNFPLKVSHVFYMAADCINNGETRMRLYATEGINNQKQNLIEITIPVHAESFIKASLYGAIPQSQYTEMNVLLYTAVNGTVFWDSVFCVDLTETFGAGNEPSKEWCDTHLSYFEGTIYISKNSYVATNMVIDPVFASGNAGNYTSNNTVCGTFGIDTYPDYGHDYLNKHNKMFVLGSTNCNEIYLTSTFKLPVIANHKYYCAMMAYAFDTAATAAIYFPYADPYPHAVGWVHPQNGWTKISAITSHENSFMSNWRFDLDNQAQAIYMWFTEMMCIDLTETFGAGNEPTKEWCDENIPWFEGTKVLGNDIVKGEKRKELWVDARDLQSTDSNDMQISDFEYNKMLWQRGLQKLADYKMVENFNSVIKSFGFIQYEYNKDYYLGDTVTIIDREIGVTVDTQITEVERLWDSKGYQFTLTFGKSQPTILDVVKRNK